MTQTDRAKEHILAGKKTKYEEQTHIALLYDVYKNGEDAAAFCAEALIARRTFYYWLKAHEKFKEAHDIVINIAERHWEKLPITDAGINHQYWYMIMKNRFGYGKPRFVIEKGQKPLDVIDAIFVALKNSELTIQEASQLASLAVTQANIENGTTEDTSNNVRHKTTDELQHRLDVINQLIKKGSEQ